MPDMWCQEPGRSNRVLATGTVQATHPAGRGRVSSRPMVRAARLWQVKVLMTALGTVYEARNGGIRVDLALDSTSGSSHTKKSRQR